MSLEGAIAANRFGLGARPGEIARASGNPKAWLMDQLNGSAPIFMQPDGQPFPDAQKLVAEEDEFKVQKFMNKGNKAALKAAQNGDKTRKTPMEKEEQNILSMEIKNASNSTNPATASHSGPNTARAKALVSCVSIATDSRR